MKVIFKNGFSLDVNNYLGIFEFTANATVSNIPIILSNITEDNLSEVEMGGETYTDLMLDNLKIMDMVTGEPDEMIKLKFNLERRSEEEIYAEAGRILLGDK